MLRIWQEVYKGNPKKSPNYFFADFFTAFFTLFAAFILVGLGVFASIPFSSCTKAQKTLSIDRIINLVPLITGR